MPGPARMQAAVPAVSVVAPLLRAGPPSQVFPGAVAVICPALREQPQRRFAVEPSTVRLEVRSLERRVVAADPDRRQGADDSVHPLRAVALGVRVLDPQYAPAVRLARQRPVEQGGPGSADVEHARGGRGEADTDGIGHGPQPRSVPVLPMRAATGGMER